MSYCNRADLTSRFGTAELIQLSDQDGSGVLDENVIALAIDDASAEIDGYLAGRYPLPLASVPPNLVRIACDLARYRLYEHQPTELVSERYQAARQYLEQIAQGRITLSPDSRGQVPASDSDGVVMQASESVFSRDAL